MPKLEAGTGEMGKAEDAYQAALARIEDAQREGATTLDLSGGIFGEKVFDALNAIPPEIANLPALTMLALNDTQVADIAPLQELPALTTLYLNFTKVADPRPLKDLEKLASGKGLGLFITETPATALDPEGLGELAEMEDDQERSRAILDYLKELKDWPPRGAQPIEPSQTAKAGAARITANPQEAEALLAEASAQIKSSLDLFQNIFGANDLPEPLKTVRAVALKFEAIAIIAPQSDQSALELRVAELEALVGELEEKLKAVEPVPESFFFGLIDKEKFHSKFSETAGEETAKLLFRWIPLGVATGTSFALGPDVAANLLSLFKAAPAQQPPPTSGPTTLL